MCGICGFAGLPIRPDIRRATLEAMTDRLRHRGPDDDGYYLDDHAALGMRRLSIIDVETGQQPVASEDGGVWAIFNGEIYNFQGLRSDLESRGHQFRSSGDTEVVVHAYEEYGEAFLSKLNGMFALALWDAGRKRLLLARDRIGIKPLYYWAKGGGIAFASELKALIANPMVPRDLDLIALDRFLTLEYVPGPRTIYEGISKLPAGHKLVFEQGEARVEAFWRLQRQKPRGGEEELVEQFKFLLDDSVRLQMVSDVPLGAFLSGGIDSSTILACMSEVSEEPIKAFSIGFEDSTYDELPYARMVARQFGADHIERVISPEIFSLTEKLVQHFDEPFADFSIFPTYLVSQLAREQVKVVLSGDGGDEILGGYETYVAQALDRYYRLLPKDLRARLLPSVMDQFSPRPEKKGFLNKAKRFIEGGSLAESLQHSRWMIFMTPEHKGALYEQDFLSHISRSSVPELIESWFEEVKGLTELAQQQYVDIHTYLPDDILTKVDRMSMAVSLEARVPFLDHRLVEFAWNLPDRLKLHQMKTKVILRRAMTDILPPQVLAKPKEGFSVPVKHWLRGALRPMMEELLSPSEIRAIGLFEPETIREWMTEHMEGRANHSHRLWSLMVFQMWRHQQEPEPVKEGSN